MSSEIGQHNSAGGSGGSGGSRSYPRTAGGSDDDGRTLTTELSVTTRQLMTSRMSQIQPRVVTTKLSIPD